MNKYLRGIINLFVGLTITLIGVLFACNVFLAGVIFFPELTIRVDKIIMASDSWVALWVPGTLPTIFLLSAIGLAAFIMVLAIRFGNKFDIEKVIKKSKAWHDD